MKTVKVSAMNLKIQGLNALSQNQMLNLPLQYESRKVRLVQEAFGVVQREMQMKRCEIQAHGQH